jgi:hypothetical protein
MPEYSGLPPGADHTAGIIANPTSAAASAVIHAVRFMPFHPELMNSFNLQRQNVTCSALSQIGRKFTWALT